MSKNTSELWFTVEKLLKQRLLQQNAREGNHVYSALTVGVGSFCRFHL